MLLDEQREILFRGKSKYATNKWVHGYLGRDFGSFKIYGVEALYSIAVYPKTIGQYTGINDCNGVKIFEHDIVYCKTYPHLMRNNKKRLDGIPKKVTGKVVMHNGAWVVKNSRGMCFPLGDVYSVKVLGNVFDDFELLEEQT